MHSSIDAIAETFRRHYDYYRCVRGETQQQQLSDERALRLQYADRTPFELVQNAFDRCERHVVVALLNGLDEIPALVVGNSDRGISILEGDEQPRPSFYFPLPLWSDRPPIALREDVPSRVTFVVVPLADRDAYRRVEKELDDSLPDSNDFLANEVRERLERLLPGLLAAAEASRYLPQGNDG